MVAAAVDLPLGREQGTDEGLGAVPAVERIAAQQAVQRVERPLPPAAAMPSVPAVLGALASFGALGVTAGVGSGVALSALRFGPNGALMGGAALALTAPALLVAQQFFGFSAEPRALIGAIAQAFTRAGQLALGLAPAMLFFAATTASWWVFFSGFMGLTGGVGLLLAVRWLVIAERRAARAQALVYREARYLMLVCGWFLLTGAIAVRIGLNLAQTLF